MLQNRAWQWGARLVAAVAMMSLTGLAQMGAPGPSPAVVDAIGKVFGAQKAFSVTMVTPVREKPGAKPTMVALPLAFLEGKVRLDLNLAAMGKGEDAAHLAAMGLNKMAFLTLPDKKVNVTLMPGLKAYCETALAVGAAPGAAEDKVETKDLGEETVDGHPCIKRQVTCTTAAGKTSDTLLWAAKDLKDMPVKAVIKDGAETSTVLFKDYQFEAPDAALFVVPPDYKKYGSMQEAMMSAMGALMPGGGGR